MMDSSMAGDTGRGRSHVEVIIMKELINGMTGNWEKVVEIYKRDRRSHIIQIGSSRNTALHLAILSRREDTALKLVQLIITNNASGSSSGSVSAVDVLSIPNKEGNTALHFAAWIGSINLCKSIINNNNGGYGYKQLMAVQNYSSSSPLFEAARNGRKDTFFWLYQMCDSDDQAIAYCRRTRDSATALHGALCNGFQDLAFQIIHRQESMVHSFDKDGFTPLHLLAFDPTSFRSGIYLSFFKNIIYNCIHVEELIPDRFKEKNNGLMIPQSLYPTNYQTCVQLFHLLWKAMKSTAAIIRGKSWAISKKPLDKVILEEGQGIDEPHSLKKGAQCHKWFSSIYRRFFKLLVLNVSKILVVIFWMILGPSEIRKLKKAKEKHVWSLQILNMLIECAKKCTYEMNPQNHETSGTIRCYSEYEYFTRGPATITPILLAAAYGVTEIVERILQEFPMTIHDRDLNGRDIVMVAVDTRQSHIYDFVLTRSYINVKNLVGYTWDDYYNTALHLTAKLKSYSGWVVPQGMLQMQWEMKWYQHVKESLMSESYYRGKYPNEIFIEEHRALLSNSKEWVKSTCNSCSVIATLIATLVFASSATVPGGLSEDNGKPIYQHHLAFRLFSVSSLVALCTSFISLLIFLSLLTTNYQYRDFSKSLPLSLIFGLTSLFTSIAAMLICFCSGHFLMLEDRFKYYVIPVYAFTCLAISYFALQKSHSYVVLLKATFSKVPQRIYMEDPV